MRLSWLTIAKPLEAAVGACRRRFALAAGLSALLNILYLPPTIDTMQVDDRVVSIGGIQTVQRGGTTHGSETMSARDIGQGI